jgi:hypothetical protein
MLKGKEKDLCCCEPQQNFSIASGNQNKKFSLAGAIYLELSHCPQCSPCNRIFLLLLSLFSLSYSPGTTPFLYSFSQRVHRYVKARSAPPSVSERHSFGKKIYFQGNHRITSMDEGRPDNAFQMEKKNITLTLFNKS